MPDERLHRIAESARNEVLRTRILRMAKAAYPNWILKPVLFTTLERNHVETDLHELDFNVHYLVEKSLLRLERIKQENDAETWRVQLTARGIDFLEGRFEEIGLASPDLVD